MNQFKTKLWQDNILKDATVRYVTDIYDCVTDISIEIDGKIYKYVGEFAEEYQEVLHQVINHMQREGGDEI